MSFSSLEKAENYPEEFGPELVSSTYRLSLKERAQNYSIIFPNRPDLWYDRNFIMGCWLVGNKYGNGTGYYGAYPNTLFERIQTLFPDAQKVLHLFSGTIKDDPPRKITFDIKPENHPTICDSALNISKYKKDLQDVDVIFADPPYEDSDFEKYKEAPFSKTKVIRELGKMMKPKSFLVWLDLRYPMYQRKYWTIVGLIAVYVGANTRVRSFWIWEHV